MPRIATPLKDTQLKNAKPRKLKDGQLKDRILADGDGLYLRVTKVGSKQWLFNYLKPYTKKRTNIGLGAYPYVSLTAAREKRLEYKTLLAQNIDPQEDKLERELEGAVAYANTFKVVADKWFEVHKKIKKLTPAYAIDIYSSLENHVFPKLGKFPIHKITAPMAIAALEPLRVDEKLVTIRRLCLYLNMIMNFAINTGIIPKGSNPLTGIKQSFGKHEPKNFATLKPEEMPLLLKTADAWNVSFAVRNLFYWQLHTMTRPAEAAGARWEEIDMKSELWIIAAGRMKRRKEHKVILTPHTLAILEAMRPLSGSGEYIFPSRNYNKKHINSESVNTALKRMGFKDRQTSHGLRALASSTLNEQAFDADLVETALAHGDSTVRGIYARSEYIERRRVMMNWWSNRIATAKYGEVLKGKKHLTIAQ